MCDTCSSIFRSNEKHEQSECPLGAALYCSCCKVRGHATLKCPNQPLWETRVPQFIEQLIPFELKVHHSIPPESRTPIVSPNSAMLPCVHRLSEIATGQKDHMRGVIKGTLDQSSKAPRPSHGDVCNQCRPVMEIPEDKDGGYTSNIRATLASNNITSSSIKKNREALEKLAAATGKKFVLIQREGLKNAAKAEIAAADEAAKVRQQVKSSEAHAGELKNIKNVKKSFKVVAIST